MVHPARKGAGRALGKKWGVMRHPTARHENHTNGDTGELPLRLAVDGKTLPDAYWQRVRSSSGMRAFFVKRSGQYQPVTWGQVHSQVVGCHKGLKALGIGKGDKVILFSQTRPEWSIADYAILAGGSVTVPIYPSSTPDDIAFILRNSDAKAVFVEEVALASKLEDGFKALGRKLPVVAFGDTGDAGTRLGAVPFAQFVSSGGSEEELRRAGNQVRPEDTASIVYTSGTTGVPKGVVLTHHNFCSGVRAVAEELDLQTDDCTLTFLPFAHILGRFESMAAIFCGVTLGFAENLSTVSQNMVELRPTLMVSVPRIFEKVYAKITADVANQPAAKQAIFNWAVKVGRQVARHRSEQTPIPLGLALKFKVADQLVFSKIRAKLGGRLKLSACGGAPLSPDLCEFFHACGVKILEGYGLTETLGPILVNRPDHYRFGTVGLPLGDARVKIAQDGEILLKGSVVFKEYFRNPEATKEVFTEDGWFCSGDIGELDSKGFLRITDRKKELIITAGGKNVAPQKIENLFKLSRYISNAMTYGDRQKYLVALICLNEDSVRHWAKAKGIGATSLADLAAHPDVNKLIEGEVSQVNGHLASYESVKKFRILPNDFTVEAGEITPSLKLKRKVITKKYEKTILEMYS